jgi:RNA polymerase sigma factor (sigma-70 family)
MFGAEGAKAMNSSLDSLLLQIRRLSRPRADSSVADAQLLERFITQRDEAAFELLVWRYERLVFGICRRLLRHTQDTEDAFQATFLALARQAASLTNRQSLASWLYKVAYRIALAARVARTRRCRREVPAAVLDAVADERRAPANTDAEDLRRLLDDELVRLPEKYRAPILLCYLQGKSYTEAARELGCPRGTLSIRLTRGRAWLRRRLSRRGITLPAGAAAALFVPGAARATADLVQATVRAVLPGATIAAAAPARVTALAESALRTTGKVRRFLPLVLLLSVGAGLALVLGIPSASSTPPRGGPAPPRQVLPLGREEHGARPKGKDMIVWGTSVKGLQAALGFALPQRSYRIGDKVEFVVQLRNVSDRPLAFTYPRPMFAFGGAPTVLDTRGVMLHAHVPAFDIPVQLTPVTLAPGKSMELGRPSFVLRAPGTEGRSEWTVLYAPAGRYKVSQRIRLEAHAAGDWLGEVCTGTLEFEVVPPAPAPVAGAGTAANTPAPQGSKPAAKTDLDLLQGTWTLIEGEAGGRKFKAVMTYTFRGNHYQLKGKLKGAVKGTFKLSQQGNVKCIDFAADPATLKYGPGAFLPHGIYRLDGDKLSLCLGDPVHGRPTEFAAPETSSQAVYILRRVNAPPKTDGK